MATYTSAYGVAGSSGCMVRTKSGQDTQQLPNTTYPISPNCMYPDDDTTDIVQGNFGLTNTFYFQFTPSGGYTTFQVQYRLKKRYSPSNAAAQDLDTSGAEVWTDYTDWTNEDGSTGDITDAKSDVVVVSQDSVRYATWQVAFAHAYNEINSFDKYAYQFRVRVYNVAGNTCGAWTVFDVPLCYAPAITGYLVQQSEYGGWWARFETNWQRKNVYAGIYDCFNNRGIDRGLSSAGNPREVGTPVIGQVAELIPSAATQNQQYVYYGRSDLYVLEDGKMYSRWLGNMRPILCANNKTLFGVFQVATRDEPELPNPIGQLIATNQQAVYTVVSSDTTTTKYDAVHLMFSWTPANEALRTETYEMEYDTKAEQWIATLENLPLDIPLAVDITPVANGEWRTSYGYSKDHLIPSNGLVCFDNSQYGSVRLKYNQSISLSDEIAGETVEVVGRDYPISRYGGVRARTIKIDAQMLNSECLGGDGWKSDLEVLTSQCDWILRIPGGEKYRVFIESLDRSTDSPTNSKLLDVSISCKVIGNE